MKKIMFIANDWFALYNYRKDLMERLVKDGNEVFACVIEDKGNSKLEELGVKVIVVPMERRGTNPIKDFGVYKKYNKIMKDIKPNIAIAYTIKACIYGGWAARKNKVPFISTITGLGSAFQRGGLMKFLVVNMYKVAFKKAKYIFFQNDDNMNVFLDNKIITKEQVIRVNGSGVDLEHFSCSEYPKNQDLTILFIGRIMKEKGINEFLYAIEKINNKNIKFEILGGIKENNIMPKVKELENKGLLKYYGQVSNVKDYIVKSNVVVVPSYHEGLNNALLEASACGRPVIATNIPGCIETFEPNITGFVCEKQSNESLYDAIVKCINTPIDELGRMGLDARAKVEKEFDRKLIIDNYLKVINECIIEVENA